MWRDAGNDRSASPAPLANAHYSLAGGFDTPSLAAVIRSEADDDDEAAEQYFRRRWDTSAISPSGPHPGTLHGPLARERNGHARWTSNTHDQPQAPQPGGWGAFVFSLASSVAGKMWSFCREGAFSGFYAGGGKGYHMTTTTMLQQDSASEVVSLGRPNFAPGFYAEEADFSGNFEQDHDTPVRPAKRLHTENSAGHGWLLVDDNLDVREASPRLALCRTSSSLSAFARPTASRANSRRSLNSIAQAASRPCRKASLITSLPVSAQARPNHATHDHRASAASMRSPLRHSPKSSRPGLVDHSPLSVEARKYLDSKDRREKEAEKAMRKMSRQVQELIRQGQAALGTKVAIEHGCGSEREGADGDAWEDAVAEPIVKW